MKRPARALLTLAAAAVTTLAALGCAPAYRGEAIHGPLDTTDPQVAAGQGVFARHCHECHPGATSGLGPSIQLSPTLIRLQVRKGLGTMPAFGEGEISYQDLDALVAYLMKVRERGVRFGIR